MYDSVGSFSALGYDLNGRQHRCIGAEEIRGISEVLEASGYASSCLYAITRSNLLIGMQAMRRTSVVAADTSGNAEECATEVHGLTNMSEVMLLVFLMHDHDEAIMMACTYTISCTSSGLLHAVGHICVRFLHASPGGRGLQ